MKIIKHEVKLEQIRKRDGYPTYGPHSILILHYDNGEIRHVHFLKPPKSDPVFIGNLFEMHTFWKKEDVFLDTHFEYGTHVTLG